MDFGAQKLLPKTCKITIKDGTGNMKTITMKSKGTFYPLGYRSNIGSTLHANDRTWSNFDAQKPL